MLQVSCMSEDIKELLSSHYVLISCEGTCEQVIVDTLLSGEKLAVPMENLVTDPSQGTPYTRLRKAPDIQEAFLGLDYKMGDNPELVLARIVDVNPGAFTLRRLYRDRVIVRDFVTQPEIEMLMIFKEGAFQSWSNHRVKGRQLKPSEFCSRELGYKYLKSERFLRDYWSDPEEVVRCIREYHSCIGRRKRGQLELADLLA